MSEKIEFEVRLMVVKHMAKMMYEMSEVDFENISPQEEQIMIEDFEEVASHLLDSLGFRPGISDDGVTFKAVFKVQEPETYIQNFLAQEPPL